MVGFLPWFGFDWCVALVLFFGGDVEALEVEVGFGF